MHSARMRDRCGVEHEHRRELVVARDQRIGVVDDLDAPVANLEQPAEPRLDAVERGADVEAADDHVAGACPFGRQLRPGDERMHAGRRKRASQPLVRGRGAAAHDEDRRLEAAAPSEGCRNRRSSPSGISCAKENTPP
jgi:hypothetical protein